MLDKIESAIKDIKAGKIVVVVDDEDRENEGDLVMAANKVTAKKINFMATHGRGLICVPLTKKRLKELNLPPMVSKNTEAHKTNFTVSVDVKKGTTTGISAADRAKTIKALINPKTKRHDLLKPGHIFPIQAQSSLKKRAGHTEAIIELCRLADIYPAGVICEIMNKHGAMARRPELIKFAKKHKLTIISIFNLKKYAKRSRN